MPIGIKAGAYVSKRASQVAAQVKNPPAMQETQEIRIRFLGQKDLLEEGIATHSNILAWRIPRTEELSLQSIALQKVRRN